MTKLHGVDAGLCRRGRRKTFDEIGAPCQDAGENENGHVLVKQIGDHGKDEVTVIFQHWIKSRTLDATNRRPTGGKGI